MHGSRRPERALARPSTPAGRTRSLASFRTSSAQRSLRTSETSHAHTRSAERPADRGGRGAGHGGSPRSRRCGAFAERLVLMAAVIFAAYLLISQLADIGFGTIADELRDAELAWVVVALILAQRRSSRPESRCEAECDTPSTPAVHRASVGAQVHQPDRAELGGSRRHQPALPAANGGASRRRRSPAERSTTSRTRSSKRRSSYCVFPSSASTSTRASSRSQGPTGGS